MDLNSSLQGATSVPVPQVFRELVLHPVDSIARRWNWKSAVLSSVIRALIFFCANLPVGLDAATAALITELTFRGVASGFYGAITEAFRFAEPEWAASLVVMVLLPIAGHSVEFGIHFLRGTAKLGTSILASVCFTSISTLFNLYAMRRGALVTGEGQQSLSTDMKRMPRLIAGFLASGPRTIGALVERRFVAVVRQPLSIPPAAQESSD